MASTIVFAMFALWSALTDPQFMAFFRSISVMMAIQAIPLIGIVRGRSWSTGAGRRFLRRVVMIWCAISAALAALSTASRYLNHGFLGWARDTEWELEWTGRLGVTLGELILVSVFVLVQLTTLTSLTAKPKAGAA